ncbi:SDR family NAD(P)-dependent oxidoreductase [Catenulispora sp. NF23]|uniref:SDR family NAD(P)-dependent oxidoreductase n=1 Tax=Catenulispora pinistramenti TaxID=2705254 RepID=A0ABS5KZL3_9ACTN|nr:SDR family NAD(P)-dependent oxidoreductase [Catenulispora pinistramenti]MBS2534101.1 SDR family NAD(P)-dependent oxidoreductase [Catenulispora pinistramenti]MBS2551527.1 SDR family NAD(P)-dependent oxidoreductase [Catenulispora pinistramenti]
MDKGSALIVGVGPGLGLALARTFSQAGHPVAMIGRDHERLAQYASTLAAEGRTARPFQADAADAEQLQSALRDAVDTLGAPEILIYNAAILAPDTPIELDADTFAQRFAVNVTGAVIATRTVLPLLAHGRGTLLFTGGALALHPSPELMSLSVGKAALRAYTQSLHEFQKGTDVHVTTVTIAGAIGGDDPRFAPGALAEAYLDLHHQPRDQWQAELLYS